MAEHPSRDDNETTSPAAARACPVCERAFLPVRRQLFCTDRCRKTAWRRRTTTTPAPAPVPPPRSRRQGTVYACPDCDTRYLAQQWCPDCNRPCRRLGTGGECVHCGDTLTVEELLAAAATP